MEKQKQKQLRVAIVGSGMAGLVTAYLLNQDPRQQYAVTLFEAGKVLSLDSASLSVQSPDSKRVDRVDLPMRAFAGGYYHNLRAMYDHLGVLYHAQPFLFDFSKVNTRDPGSAEKKAGNSYFIHSSNNHRVPPVKPNAIGTTSHLIEIVYLMLWYTWFSLCCFFVRPYPANETQECETIDQYLKRIRMAPYFVSHYLLPLMSGVSTCPHETLLAFPASDVLEYKRLTHRAQHYTVSNGVCSVQNKLVKDVNARLAAVVEAIDAEDGVIQVTWRSLDHENDKELVQERFDRVILAVSPDIVGKIFRPLRYEMEPIPTAVVESVIHTDETTLGEPIQEISRGFKRSDAQIIHLRTSTAESHITESVHVQPSGAIVTTCPFSSIDPDRIIQSSTFTRVLRNPRSRRIVNNIFSKHYSAPQSEKERLGWKNGDGGVWLAGGWCWDGMVLLEGCVVSAMRVADDFGVPIPWRCGAL
ncbi:FAD/NAD(P)-binding domain-containing protein [Mytilinidion resinicola]|uniref:FAD/NAD(P)-binding domain-containing protein n=1 Tax=Mytilinidion resinicola TaxID=574789 RepID=A0A6A6YW28_9PEZI|nr:FAD/NAD(P)-binding domain-containing protein [Mytilinidion resinicola]KAF2812593.1 FAD/NAD(P)-binding domain-containing protein [Mytilinidion resinicola]